MRRTHRVGRAVETVLPRAACAFEGTRSLVEACGCFFFPSLFHFILSITVIHRWFRSTMNLKHMVPCSVTSRWFGSAPRPWLAQTAPPAQIWTSDVFSWHREIAQASRRTGGSVVPAQAGGKLTGNGVAVKVHARHPWMF